MESQQTKRALWMTVVGALLGGLLTTWLAPKMIAWYFAPPAQLGFNCAEPITWALGKLQVAQAIGILGGAAIGVALYVGLGRRRPAAATV